MVPSGKRPSVESPDRSPDRVLEESSKSPPSISPKIPIHKVYYEYRFAIRGRKRKKETFLEEQIKKETFLEEHSLRNIP
jgi:hypothetical protein